MINKNNNQKRSKKQKLYCYVDESGQDTKGQWFLVAIVLLSDDRDKIALKLKLVEQESGKFKTKWHKSKHQQRIKYLNGIVKIKELKSSLYYSIYKNTILFTDSIALTTAKVISVQNLQDYQAQIVIDGLRKNLQRQFSATVRKLGIKTTKVKGARDESDPIIRLADTIAGLLRDYYEKKSWTNRFVKLLVKNNYVHEI